MIHSFYLAPFTAMLTNAKHINLNKNKNAIEKMENQEIQEAQETQKTQETHKISEEPQEKKK